ncbi:TMAO reductase system sensor histidine kinase/response regulator TorS [Vibrio hannami]|uniref:TMAO reductase system sensor histidine kinase/response regulator TorS n=1 Tax=Vibrio hannami TaxID=2717094 RepID=UPI00240EEBEA|nr:TMAO reductase system sensor histidine kinase/response regulator TorS [Vibrio hannami]MDG3085229.1 TMAO reductase system sensor histidine kinase/response regulator TorS [Vibrio hannami]
MLLAPASIGRKLLFSFTAMAGLLILAVTIGTSGFNFVAKTEKKVVDSAIPAMLEAREVAGLSSRIISSVQVLSNAESELERRQSGQQLFTLLEKLLNHIELLGNGGFDDLLLAALERDVQTIIDTIAKLGVSVEKKLALDRDLILRVNEMRTLADELEELTRTQVRNTSTITVANVTQLYGLVEEQETDTVFDALDTLVEVDLDLSERLHELHLLAFQMLAHIEESQTVTDYNRIQQIGTEFESNLKIMERRVRSVEDPTRSEQMGALLSELRKRIVMFDILNQRFEIRQSSQALEDKTLEVFESLNETVNKLVDESNRVTAKAVSDVTQTLSYAKWSLVLLSLVGLIAISIIIWRIVYQSVVKRLHAYSDALVSIASGEVNFDLSVKGKDEIAQMGRAIITARDTAKQLQIVAKSEKEAKLEIQQHKAQLEDTIKERTMQLSLANDQLNEEVAQHAKARDEAEQANRAKSAFLSTMSHEIRTPMNGVLGTATLLKSTGLNSQQSYYVDVINRSGSNLLAILNDVLDYSKIEAGRLEIRPSPFELCDLINDTFRLLESRAKEKGLGFHRQIESDISGYWLGDATRIGQVLNNLLGNAIKFTHQGDIDLYVSEDPELPGNLLFEVTDTGIGIDPEEADKLFKVFSQLGSEAAKAGGTGLGLAISQKLVEAMDGYISVESESGQGSRFWFSIPLEKTEKPTVLKSELQRTTTYKAKILMVEDNPVNCLVAEGFLSVEGHQIVIAEDGVSGEKAFREEGFDIALLDINLPDCNGVELLSRLRQIESDKGNEPIPMVAVSAHVFNEEVENYLNAGFDSFLPKPLDKKQLSDVVQASLEGRTLLLQQTSAQGTKQENVVVDFSVIEADLEVLGAEKIQNLLELFKESSSDLISQLDKAAEENNRGVIKQLAHKLKGSAGTMGMTWLYNVCLEVESDSNPLEKYREQKNELVDALNISLKLINKKLN